LHFKNKRKIMLIGGGEIGTEIGLAALRKKWLVRAIVSEQLPPIKNILYYSSGIVEDCCVPAFTNDSSKLFQYVHPESISNNTAYIADCVDIEKPDIVLLEDVFMTAKEWKDLHTHLADLKYFDKKKTYLLPSPTEQIKTLHKTFVQSDVFLDKTEMKAFLEEIGESDKLLGSSQDTVEIATLSAEVQGRSQPDHPLKKIRESLRKRGKLVFKPTMTSSGYGQFVLSNVSELHPDFLSKMIEIQKQRVKNDRYLFEKYVGNRAEYCSIVSMHKDKRKCLVGISYTKYDSERYPLKEQYAQKDLQGTVRLLQSETKKDQTLLWHAFREMSGKIQEATLAPFVYVEFIVDEKAKDKRIEAVNKDGEEANFYINEISYRPDDAGFISRISHEKSQFELFLESLEFLLERGPKIQPTTLLPVIPLGEYCCYTLIPLTKIQFTDKGLNHEHGAGSTQVKFRLYEKTLPKVDGKIPVPSRRIIGYLMHHSSQDGIEILKTRMKILGLSTETVETLVEALGLTKMQLKSNGKSLFVSKSPSRRIIVVSDWEGPWVIADYAYEIMNALMPDGDRIFSAISEYDDYLAYIRKKRGYEPGDTLALIAPFLIAYDVDEKGLQKTASDSARFITESIESLKTLSDLGYPVRIVSTSYCQYVWLTTALAGIPQENTKCTPFSITDFKQRIQEKDKELVKAIIPEILGLGKLGINASSTDQDLLPAARETISKMDEFFWELLPKTSFGPVLESIKPLGGSRKLRALEDILKVEGQELKTTVVIGDSITDWVMLKKVKQSGGLAISFNGNSYAIKNANLAVISNNCVITPILVQIFERAGLDGVRQVTKSWSLESLRTEVNNGHLDATLFHRFQELQTSQLPEAHWVTGKTMEALIKTSTAFRKSVRGSAVGSLG
jgi:energy-converting hydrogenase A subunit R